MQNIIWKTDDGSDLTLYLWDQVAIPKGIVQIVHDVNEHMMRYNEFAEHLNSQGFMVIGADQRAHGMTAKTRDNIGKYPKGYDIYNKAVFDQTTITEYLSFMYSLPIIILGQGIGAFLVQDYLLKRVINPKVQAFVLTSPTLLEGFTYKLCKLAVSLGGAEKEAKFLYKNTYEKYDKKFNEGKNAWRCRDKKVVELYNKDEFIIPRFPNAYFKSVFKNARKLYKKPYNNCFDMPVLISAGNADQSNLKGAFANGVNLQLKDMGFQRVDFKLYAECRYEILNEPNKKQIWKDIITFMTNNTHRV